jgi:O-antigen/teichoic acid export membrane protein
MAQSIINNFFISTTGRIAHLALGLLVVGLITRILGPGEFGLYILLLSFGIIVQLLADFGLYLTVTRELARDSRRQSEVLSNGLSLRIFLLLIMFGLGGALIVWLPQLASLWRAYVILSFGLSLQSVSQLLMGVFQHYQSVWRASLGDLLGRLVQLFGVLIAGLYMPTVLGMISVFTAAAAVTFVIHQFLLPTKVAWRFRVDVKQWKLLMASSWPLGLMLLLNAVFFRIDTLVLSWFRSADEVGWYGLAYRVVESGLFFPAMLGGLLLPRLSESLQRQKLLARQYINEGLILVILLAGYVIVFLALAAADVVDLIGGYQFEPTAPLLKVLGVSLGIMFVGNIFGFALVALEQQRRLVKLYAGLAIFNFLGNVLLIPSFGALAAAWTTVITEFFSMTIAGWYVYRLLPFSLSGRALVGFGVSIAAVSVMLWWLPTGMPVVIKFIITVVLYVALLWWLKVIGPTQLKLLVKK